jgi:hypothetical protein
MAELNAENRATDPMLDTPETIEKEERVSGRSTSFPFILVS